MFKSFCRTKKIIIMKKLLFIALFGILFLVGCSNQNKAKEATTEEATEQVEGDINEDTEDPEGAIDDSGEAVEDSIDEIEAE